ncbi:hypothetical protein [Geobacter benzoatilyticus]|uniref:Uncharacterized protein n=1 Tax=Geobacter benzoatilyticus TaxID=2815309 RepID=A0ABX7Q0W5_9BACT|nr:hypothetical protein [Geobacter benzoatilyticus]QSV44751.1 hypothetical protein JZM60_11320 [Geobacter benzoatilyticus]
MTPDEKQDFADRFMALYLSMGLGSLPKREIDLFVFHFLLKSSDYRGKSNYELANNFGVPESKIKALRLTSALRHEQINSHAVLSRIVDRLIHSEQYAALAEGKIEISLEDPVEKRELENFLKARGHHAEYTLNSEVLKISAGRLLELIMEHADRANDEFDRIVRAHIADHEVSERILADAPTLKQKLDKLRAENLNMDTLKALIGAGFGLLTGA